MTNDYSIPPRDEELEESVLGCILMDIEAAPIGLSLLSEDSFYNQNRMIYNAIKEDYDSHSEVDYMRVEHILKNRADNEEFVAARLGEMTIDRAMLSKLEEYCEILNGLSAKRDAQKGLITELENINQRTPQELFTNIENIVHQNVDSISIPGMTYSEIKARDEMKEESEQLYTGIKFFDHVFFGDEGSRRGGVLVPGADSGMGKTSFAVWLTARYLEQGYKGVFCIRESKDSKIADRIYNNMRDKSNIENLIIADVMQGLNNLSDIESTVKYHNALCGIDFFVADHLRIIPVKGLNEWQETKRITTCVNRLMYLSQQVDAFCIAPSQVNRETQRNSRGWDKLPKLHNLYGSSAIEQAASMAVSIFRPKEVEELHEYHRDGSLRAVRGPNYDNDGVTFDKNSVFIRQIKNREGERYNKLVRFVHTDEGLVHKSGNKNKREVPF